MKKMPTIKDRLKFVEQTFKNQSNIKVLHLEFMMNLKLLKKMRKVMP